MKITAYIRKKTAAKNNVTDQATIYFRVRDGQFDCKAASELTINPNHWSDTMQGYKARVALVSDEKRRLLNRQVKEITDLISDTYHIGIDNLWLKRLILEYHHPNIYKNGVDAPDTKLSTQIMAYIRKHSLSQKTIYKFNSFLHKLDRYERYEREVKHKRNFVLYVDTMTADNLYNFKSFCTNEYQMVNKYPQLYSGLKDWRKPKDKLSENAIYDIFHNIRTIIKWCEFNGISTQNPFDRFELSPTIYCTPYFLTIEERNLIFDLDLDGKPNQLGYHRDIFMFQCLVGCRMGDIPRMTKDNIVDGALEYIPHKTMKSSSRTIRVPLNDKAKLILERYKDRTTTLFPYFEDCSYNNSIRELCVLAGITRVVSIIDQKTREEVKRPICEIASSHMGRRTFIGNMYKKVKDPNLIASMSGHAEGSKAFSRYRAIDDEMKRELVEMIN